MVTALWILYAIGIPITFWLLGGFTDLKPEPKPEDETPFEARERMADIADGLLSALITFCISACWPLFWGLNLAIFLFGRFFRLS